MRNAKEKELRTRVRTSSSKVRTGLIAEKRAPMTEAVEDGVRTIRGEVRLWLVNELPAYLDRARETLRAAGLPDDVAVAYLWKPDGRREPLTADAEGEDDDVAGDVFEYLLHRDSEHLTDEYLAARLLRVHAWMLGFLKAGNTGAVMQHCLELGWLLREWKFRAEEERLAVAGRSSMRNLKKRGKAHRVRQQSAQMDRSEIEACARGVWASMPSLQKNDSETAREILRRKRWPEKRFRNVRRAVGRLAT